MVLYAIEAIPVNTPINLHTAYIIQVLGEPPFNSYHGVLPIDREVLVFVELEYLYRSSVGVLYTVFVWNIVKAPKVNQLNCFKSHCISSSLYVLFSIRIL